MGGIEYIMSLLVPSGLVETISPGAYNVHPHTPGFGGEIAWNDIQAIRTLNGIIRNQNRELAASHGVELSDLERLYGLPQEEVDILAGDDIYLHLISKKLIPYILPMDKDFFPTEGYNKHDHVNDFNGGAVIGAGNHDHRGAGYAGYAFAVFHPGTKIPLRSMRIDV